MNNVAQKAVDGGVRFGKVYAKIVKRFYQSGNSITDRYIGTHTPGRRLGAGAADVAGATFFGYFSALPTVAAAATLVAGAVGATTLTAGMAVPFLIAATFGVAGTAVSLGFLNAAGRKAGIPSPADVLYKAKQAPVSRAVLAAPTIVGKGFRLGACKLTSAFKAVAGRNQKPSAPKSPAAGNRKTFKL